MFEFAVLGFPARSDAPPYSEDGRFGVSHERATAETAMRQWRHRFPSGVSGEQFHTLVIEQGYACEERVDAGAPYLLCHAERRFRRDGLRYGDLFNHELVRLRILLSFRRSGESIVLTGYAWQNLGELN